MQQQESSDSLQMAASVDSEPQSDEVGTGPDAATIMKTRATLLGVAALYGTNFGSIKIMQESLEPSTAALLRFTIALVALSPYLRTTPKELIKPGLEVGLWVSLGYFVQGIGLETCDASTAAFLCSLAVVVCPLLDLFAGEPVKFRSWVAAALAVIGVGVLELGGGSAPSSGDLWALLQPVGFGMGFWKIERLMKEFPGKGPELTAIQLVVVFFAGLVWSLWDSHGLPDFSLVMTQLQSVPIATSVVWTGLVTTALTVLLQTTSLGVLSSTETTVLYSTEPLWGAAFASVALGEHIGQSTVVGGALILAACLSSSVDEEDVKSKAKSASSLSLKVATAILCAIPGGATLVSAFSEKVSDKL